MAEVLTKNILADSLVEKFDLTKKAALEIVDCIFNEMTKAYVAEQVIDIAGFGKFFIKERAERNGINPKTLEKIVIGPSKVPSFKASKVLKTAVK